MQPLYDHYLQFIRSSLKNDTSFSGAIPDVVDYDNKIKFLLDNVRNNKKIRIWSSHKNSNEYMTVFYICNLLEKYDAELLSDRRLHPAHSLPS